MNGAAALLALMMTVPLPTADLGGYLERSAASEFTGEQVVSCETPDGVRTSVFRLAQAGGMAAAWSDEDADSIVTIGPGTATVSSGEETNASVVEAAGAAGSSGAYRVGNSEDVTFLGRDAVEVSILRDDAVRVVLTVDADSDVVVRTRTYDKGGNVYCDRRMISFVPQPPDMPLVAADADTEPATPVAGADVSLPEEVEGFSLLDTYAVDDGTLSYYSDGFFTFGVVLTDRPVGLDDDEAVTVETDGGSYQRLYEPGRVTVTWTAGSESIALIGDLPPDLTDAVLEELPAPATPGFLSRIWSRFFD